MGSHTSILISESLEGLKVAVTRQNVGSCLKTAFSCAAPRPPSGSENCPAATAWADVMVVFSSESDFRLSQAAAATGAGANATIVTPSTNKTKLKLRKFIVHSLATCSTVAALYFGDGRRIFVYKDARRVLQIDCVERRDGLRRDKG